MKLAKQQQEASDQILKWHSDPQNKSFVLSGYAGTGKTTLAKHIANMLGEGNVLFCAYTGKAANVLKEKGCLNASTIHRSTYRLVGTHEGEPRFELDERGAMSQANLVIIDEYSMLPQNMIDDIESVAKKVLYLGDPFQLPPISGRQELTPDFCLTDVHRQALDSPVLRAATLVREGSALNYSDSGDFIYQPANKMNPMIMYNVDQCIVGRNKTRREWNNMMLEHYGFSGGLPDGGEKVICLKNNADIGLFNGMIGVANDCGIDFTGQHYLMSFNSEGEKYPQVRVSPEAFLGQPYKMKRRMNYFDYGYAITCHKSQGSEFDSVLVKDESWGTYTEKRRWLYTALTRARKKVYLQEG